MNHSARQFLKTVSALFILQTASELITPPQLNAQPFPETFYLKENTRTRKPFQYIHERETDIMWSKRVWRTLDLREKFNHPLYFPETPTNARKSLFDIIKQGLLDGEIHAFDNPVFDDEFKVRMSKGALDSLFTQIDSLDQPDPNDPNQFIRVAIRIDLESSMIKQYWMKEDWFFDRQRSVMDVRIIGLCPLREKKDPVTNDILGYIPLFWVYFPECRPLLARSEIFNVKNDAARCSADDVFHKRMFSSFVNKESNVYDRTIGAYTTGLDALLEAERVKKDIEQVEHDVWHL